MQTNPGQPNLTEQSSVLETIAVLLVVVAGLYLGAGILVPLVLAILLAFALAPLVNMLERLHVPDVLAVLLAFLLAAGVLGVFAYIASTQLIALATDLPGYQSVVTEKIRGLQASFGGSGVFFERATQAIEALGNQIDGSNNELVQAPGTPIPVTISNDAGNPLGIVSAILGSVLGPLATTAIVSIFLIFLLLGRDDLRDRFIRLVSRGNFSTTTLVINDAAARVARYLLVQFGVNFTYGIVFGSGLMLIGVPNAVLWGLMATLFRYIPFVGTLIVASIPFALAFTVDPGWNMLILSVALFATLELVTTNAIEPRLYGTSTGLSPLAVLLAAMFWATIWGPVGLILSTPLTVCLVVLGHYIPQLRFLDTMLGSDPVLTPQERLYQRLLAGDTDEAIDIAEEVIAEKDHRHFLENILLPALRQASLDLKDNPETAQQRRRMANSLSELIGDVAPTEGSAPPNVLLIGGKTELDEGAAMVVSQALAEDGIGTEVLPPVAIRQETIGQIDLDGFDIVCLVYLGSEIRASARYAARRLRRLKPGLVILVSHLTSNEDPLETAETLRVNDLANSLDQTQILIREHLTSEPVTDATARSRLETAGHGDPELTAALADIAEAVGVPLATLNLLEDERHHGDKGAYALTEDVVMERRPIVIHAKDDKNPLSSNTYLIENGVEFYAAVPLQLADQRVIGSVAVLDYEPREFSDADLEKLQQQVAALAASFGNPVPEKA